MKGGDILIETLKAYDVEYVFGMPGGDAINYCWLRAEESGIKPILIRNEMSGALMADGYARASFKPAVSMFLQVGAMYMATGLMEAFHGSIPVIGITHTGGSRIYSMAHSHRESHYVNIVPLFQEITKWTVVVDRVDKIHELTRRAFAVATTGRPGPVVLILRDDEMFKETDVEIAAENEYSRYPALRQGPNLEAIRKAADVLIEAKRPVIYAGGGVTLSQAWDDLRELAELLGAPVATSLNGKGAFPDTHPLGIGVGGSRCAYPGVRGQVTNTFLTEADVALLIGTKMGLYTEFNFTKTKAKIIQIDVDPFEIGKNQPADIGIVGDAKFSLRELIKMLEPKIHKKKLSDILIVKEIHNRMKEWRDENIAKRTSDAVPIKISRLMTELQSFMDENTLVALCGSTPSIWGAGNLDSLKGGRNFIQPRGMAALGFIVPLSLGAKLGAPHKRVFCIVGDGSFGYSLGELETAVRYNIDVIFIVLNNTCLGWEKRSIEDVYKRKTSLLDLSAGCNYGKVMEAIGGYGATVERPGEIKDAIARAIEAGKPAVLDVRTDYKDTMPLE
jgi:acetolactate synthase-1/2/3 large subunit